MSRRSELDRTRRTIESTEVLGLKHCCWPMLYTDLKFWVSGKMKALGLVDIC